ncbi:MAG: methyltransferase RsmF C-terminal domain-like protein, partial [Cyclobacteriaceae bacterium]
LSASTEESQNGIYRFFPHVRQGEGFSYFIIQKQSASGSVNLPRMKTRKVDDLPVEIGVEGRVVKENDRFIFYTHDQDSDLLSKQLRMIKKGLSLGVMKKNRWIPDPETSFSVAIKNFLPELDLDPAQVLRFLRCETFDLFCEERGYHLIKFEGHGLGYINHLGNRFNNYYPSNWRIRTQQSLNRTALF